MDNQKTTPHKVKFDIPRDLLKNVAFRADVIRKCSKPGLFRDNMRELCARDPVVWINLFAYTKDPKKPFKVVPFILYEEFQDDVIWELVEAIEKGHDALIEKTREMGVSWMVLYVFAWYWLFVPNSDFLVGSRKEDVVDKKGDPSTLFEKIRILLKNLPLWMLPDGFDLDDDAMTMRVINKDNGNSIIGESANPYFGSGGRTKAILLDEYSKWDPAIAESSWTSTADVTRCRIPVSTPLGSANKFAQLAEGTKEKIKKLTVHWTLHPDKGKGVYYFDGDGKKIPIKDARSAFKLWQQGLEVKSPWYDIECARRSEADIAQELDISYLKSGHPFFSIKMLKKQSKWQYYKRKNPFAKIPYGHYVTGKITKHENQVQFVECEYDAWLKVYEEPLLYLQYVLGGDTSEGLAKGDESVALVRNSYTRNVCAEISGLIPNDEFAVYCYLLAQWYNDCLCAVESLPSAYGLVVNKGMQKLGAKMYHSKNVKGEEQELPGYEMNARTRPAMLSVAEEDIRRSVCEVRSEKALKQMNTFVRNPKKGGRPEADGEMLDDEVIAFAISGQVISEHPFNPHASGGSIFDKDTSKKTKRKQKRKATNAGFGF